MFVWSLDASARLPVPTSARQLVRRQRAAPGRSSRRSRLPGRPPASRPATRRRAEPAGAILVVPVLDGVPGRAAGVGAASGRDPGVSAGLGLGEDPAGGLLLVMVMTASRAAGARAGGIALFPGHGVVEVAAGGVALAGRPTAGAVPDFDEVAECGAGVVGGGVVAVIAVGDWEGLKLDSQVRWAVPAVPVVPAVPAVPVVPVWSAEAAWWS